MIEQTYHDLMSKLSRMPAAIAQAREAYDQAVKAVKDCERMSDDKRAQAVIFAGGYSKLGTNDKDREYKLIELLRNSSYYQSLQSNLRNAEQHKAETKRNLDNALTDFDSLRIQASLLGDLMKYSALSAAKPSSAELLDL